MVEILLENQIHDDIDEMRPDIISYGKLFKVDFCPYAHYLQYIEKKLDQIPMRSFTAKGFFIHHMIYSKKSGLFKPDKSVRYKSAERFANTARTRWRRFVCRKGKGKWHDRKIAWKYEEECYAFAQDIREACRNYYENIEHEKSVELCMMLEQGIYHEILKRFQGLERLNEPRFRVFFQALRERNYSATLHYLQDLSPEKYSELLSRMTSPIAFTDRWFAFPVEPKGRESVAGGRKFKVHFDEIRGLTLYFDEESDSIKVRYGTIAREIKTKETVPSMPKVKGNLELTLQALAFCTLARQRDSFREKCGVSDELAALWEGNPHFIDPEIELQFYNIKKNKLLSVTKNNEDFEELLEKIDEFDQMVASQKFPPNQESCWPCAFNVYETEEDRKKGKAVCKHKSPKAKTPEFHIT